MHFHIVIRHIVPASELCQEEICIIFGARFGFRNSELRGGMDSEGGDPFHHVAGYAVTTRSEELERRAAGGAGAGIEFFSRERAGTMQADLDRFFRSFQKADGLG